MTISTVGYTKFKDKVRVLPSPFVYEFYRICIFCVKALILALFCVRIKKKLKREFMRKLNIVNLFFVGASILVEALAMGAKIVWGKDFYQSITYHSYFDTSVWVSGNVGPMLCGIFSGILFCMLLASLIINPNRIYYLATGAVAIAAIVFSTIPVFYDAYTLTGLIITILLAISLEISAMMFMDKNKK